MRVTIKDIATAAGVKPAVVSAVLNGSRTIRFSDKTRDRILELVRKMRYRPNRVAQGLVTKKSRLIGVLCYSPRDPSAARIIDELQTQLSEQGYNAIFGFWRDAISARSAFESVLVYPLDGLICIHSELYDMIPENLPTVFGEYIDDSKCSVIPDTSGFIRSGLEYLTGLGHRRIGYFSWVNPVLAEKFVQTAKELGVETSAAWSPRGTGFYDKAIELGSNLFRSDHLPTALLCTNDITAFAAINAARAAGLRIPEDISIIGMDNIDIAGYFDPPLTTFAFPYHEYVAQTLECLFAGALPGCRKIRMPLVVRKTAAPPGKAAPVLPQGCPADPVRQKNSAKEPA